MKIIVDAFGGDHAPLEIIKGCRQAADKLGVNIVLTGSEEKILACAKEHKLSLAGMEILEAPGVFAMDNDPVSIIKEHKDSSMAVGIKSLAEKQADAFVSAGSTGGLLVGATLKVKRVRGVRRPCIGAILPGAKAPFVLLDGGANTECTAEMLNNFALLGSVYAKQVLGLDCPRVGLANIGTEETKGDALRLEAFAKLRENANINFIGNVEPREIPNGGCDVVVADGFTGNIMLKLYEGMGVMMKGMLKRYFLWNPLNWPGLLRLRKQMDYKTYGGAPLLGLNAVVIKAHGSSDATGIFHAIRQAKGCVEQDIVGMVKGSIAK